MEQNVTMQGKKAVKCWQGRVGNAREKGCQVAARQSSEYDNRRKQTSDYLRCGSEWICCSDRDRM
jgi:hypothetical protein